MLSVPAMADVLFQDKWQEVLSTVTGGALKLPIFFRWGMKSTGFETTILAGLLFSRLPEDLSTRFRMAYCLELMCTYFLTTMLSQSTLMYEHPTT
jgi:hypothetical protein